MSAVCAEAHTGVGLPAGSAGPHTVAGVDASAYSLPARADADVDDVDLDALITRSSVPAGRESVAALSALQRAADAYPQLPADAQLELHARFRDGQAARAELDAGVRGAKAARARRRVRDGDEAYEYLVACNQRLVRLICREQAERRYGRERAAAVLPDLVAEANVALAGAVTSFDPSRTPRFATWAGAQVRTTVRASLSEQDVPTKLPSSWRRFKRIAAVRQHKLADQLGRSPSTEELQSDLFEYCVVWSEDHLPADQQQLPTDQRRQLAIEKMRKQGTERALREIEKLLQVTRGAQSLDAPVTDDGSRTFGDGMAAAADDDVLDPLDMSALKKTLRAALGDLTEREQRVVLLRYGVGSVDGQPMTYTEMAPEFDVTPERVRQIEARAMEKLRSGDSQVRGHLASFLPGLEGVDLDARVEKLRKPRKK